MSRGRARGIQEKKRFKRLKCEVREQERCRYVLQNDSFILILHAGEVAREHVGRDAGSRAVAEASETRERGLMSVSRQISIVRRVRTGVRFSIL